MYTCCDAADTFFEVESEKLFFCKIQIILWPHSLACLAGIEALTGINSEVDVVAAVGMMEVVVRVMAVVSVDVMAGWLWLGVVMAAGSMGVVMGIKSALW